jgi:menaquinone-specific isochorismate synthase
MAKAALLKHEPLLKIKGKNIYKREIKTDTPLLSYLSSSLFQKFFFKPKESEQTHLALGSLITLSPKEALTFQNAKIRLYGGICFDEKKDPVWGDLYKSSFFLPEFELTELKGKTSITQYSLTKEFSDLPPPTSHFQTKKLQAKKLNDLPELSEWQEMVTDQQSKMGATPLKKIVLCRRTEFDLEETPSFETLIRHLLRVPNSHVFGYIQTEENGFFGASPETLFTRVKDFLKTEAIAGTRKRGKTPSEDNSLANELEKSGKDLEEFTLVKENIIQTLQELGANVTCKKNTLYKNPYIQHLHSNICANITSESFSIIQKLHPTPAIGGHPKDLALSILSNIEPFSRRFYCSALGFTGGDSEVFAVGIRSFLINKRRLYVYAGVGVVPSSCPKLEWKELELKTLTILKSAGLINDATMVSLVSLL